VVEVTSFTNLAQVSGLGFPEIMNAVRKRSGLSGRALSRAAGKSPSYISKMERGEFLPTVDTFAGLVRALQCTDAEVVFLVRMLNDHADH